MSNISNDIRRVTVDLYFDFIKKSISDDSIKVFVNQMNTVSDVSITIIGKLFYSPFSPPVNNSNDVKCQLIQY